MTPTDPAYNVFHSATASAMVEKIVPATGATSLLTPTCQVTFRLSVSKTDWRRLYGPPPRSPLNPYAKLTRTSFGVTPCGKARRPSTGSTATLIGRATL